MKTSSKRAVKQKLSTSWDLSPLFKNDTDPAIDKELSRAKLETERFVNKWKDRSDYLENEKALLEALSDYERWITDTGVVGKAGYYFWLRLSQEENNSKLKARGSKIQDQARKLANDTEFFMNRLSKIKPVNQKKFLTDKKLSHYHAFLDDLFKNAKYILSEAEEKILTLKGGPAHGKWVSMTSNLLAKEERLVIDNNGNKTPLPWTEIISLCSSKKKKVRDQAVEAFNDILARHLDPAEHEINAILDNKKTGDELRGFSRPDEGRHLSDNINTEAVDAMLEEVEKRFDISKRFYKLKAKLLKQKTLAYHERNVPYGTLPDGISYDQAVEDVGKVLAELDDEFYKIYTKFVKDGHIDVFPKKDRSGGAFCAHDLITAPTYILLNHTGKFQDVLTLAHEVGHGINNELIKTKQSAIYFGTPTSTAEVASTFIEDYVFDKMTEKAEDKERLVINMAKLNDDVSSIFRQVACYRFEQELHDTFRKEGYLDKDKIGQIFRKNMRAYMGPAVDQSVGSENWWVYWSHIRSFFYVYSYASGLLISKSLREKVSADKKFVTEVKKFLSAGESNSPKNLFADLGINISEKEFWSRGLDSIDRLLKETENLARKYG